MFNISMKENDRSVYNSCIFIVIWGIFMHIILLWGVMDANFHSPIIPGLSIMPMPKNSPAKRIFIFVADGLRYRTFKDHTPPYLNSIIQKNGVWGISHTRIPTESRPGNIAIVAGLYEDPSAVFKGWKENPVDFDSVFNKSQASWLWGSPDIISLFVKDNYKIHGKSYPAHWQDFNNEPVAMKRLDLWVFNEYWNWLKTEASNYKTKNKIIFYFHLLGCDTIGHASKPQSKEYIKTMMDVDFNIQEVVQKTENYFNDDSTAYIFTSDHGMTDWGSHGSGSTDETETPFVAWGAGLTKDSHLHNIEQIDITPLISTLLGIPIPINNEGVLPYKLLDLQYKEFITNAFLINAKQLAEQVKANRELTVGRSLDNMYCKDKELSEKLINTEKLLKEGKIKECTNKIKYIIKLAKETLIYYRHYQTNRYFICLAVMWIGWIIFLFVDLSGIPRQTINLGCFSWMLLANISLVIAIIPFIIEYIGCKEWRLLGYGIISILSLWFAFRAVIKKGPNLEINSNKPLVEFIGIICLTFMMFIGLIYRWTFSISMLFTVKLLKFMFDKKINFQLMSTGVILSIFPLLPVVGTQPKIYIVVITLGISAAFVIKKRKIYKFNKVIEITRIILSSLLCLDLIDGRSWLSWAILLSTPFVIWLYPTDCNLRIFGISMALLSPLSLLSTSYETIFFFIFTTHLQYWPMYEHLQKLTSNKKILNIRNFSTAALLMFYTLICFFGTGNIASISSFDPIWTRHFVTIFSPITMMTLIILKIVIPLILIGCLIRVLTPDSTVFFAVLFLGDCLAIPLMYGVTTEGSWLDIGSAISRFVIAIILPCLLLLVYYLAKPLITFSLLEFIQGIRNKKQRFKI